MKKNYWWFMVVIVFVAGLMISNMLVQAKENTPVIKWEYTTVNINYIDQSLNELRGPKRREPRRGDRYIRHISSKDVSILNKHGKDGWELCGVCSNLYFFKREIKE
jgi:hypothetical protein